MWKQKPCGNMSLTLAKWKHWIRRFSSLKFCPTMATTKTGSMRLNTWRTCHTGLSGRIWQEDITTFKKLFGIGNMFTLSIQLTRLASSVSTAVRDGMNIWVMMWHVNLVFTVKSIGEFKFTDINNQDTLCTETVKYQCPPFLGSYCRKEVEYQRKKILYNLAYHFSQQT